MPNYRIVVSYSEQKTAYIARAPELEGCEAEGETRAEALARLEEEITAQVDNIKEQGGEPPTPLDEQEFDGRLSLTVTGDLHRDLVFSARMQKVELEVLLTELLTRGLYGRSPARGRPRQEGREGREGRGRQREGQGRYHEIMENRADFIEYVRRLEGGGGGGGRGGGRGRKGGR
jgi:predicted RNase H-like HicB family nuclease